MCVCVFEHYWVDSVGSFVVSLQLLGSVALFGGQFGSVDQFNGSGQWIGSMIRFSGSL